MSGNWAEFGISVVLAVLGYFMLRAIKQLDSTVVTLTTEVTDLKAERRVQEQLNEFQERRMTALESENTQWRRIIGALDKIIYKELGIDINTL